MKTEYHNSILSKRENLRYRQKTDTWNNLNAIELSHFNTLLPLKLEKNPASIEPSGRMKLIIEGGQSIKKLMLTKQAHHYQRIQLKAGPT